MGTGRSGRSLVTDGLYWHGTAVAHSGLLDAPAPSQRLARPVAARAHGLARPHTGPPPAGADGMVALCRPRACGRARGGEREVGCGRAWGQEPACRPHDRAAGGCVRRGKCGGRSGAAMNKWGCVKGGGVQTPRPGACAPCLIIHPRTLGVGGGAGGGGTSLALVLSHPGLAFPRPLGVGARGHLDLVIVRPALTQPAQPSGQ